MLLLALFTSCKKTTNVDVHLANSGKLIYRLVDDDGKGLPNVKVSLFDRADYYYTSSSVLLDARSTDANGKIDFGELNPSNYQLIADSAKVSRITYSVQEYIQVVPGVTKEKETKVSDHSGTFVLTVTAYNSSQPLRNIGVMMVPANKFNYSYGTSGNLASADFRGVTNESGSITFKIPSNKPYTVCVYNTVTNVVLNYNNGVAVQKDATVAFSMNLYQ